MVYDESVNNLCIHESLPGHNDNGRHFAIMNCDVKTWNVTRNAKLGRYHTAVNQSQICPLLEHSPIISQF